MGLGIYTCAYVFTILYIIRHVNCVMHNKNNNLILDRSYAVIPN